MNVTPLGYIALIATFMLVGVLTGVFGLYWGQA